MVLFTEWKIADLNQRLETFELIVLARPAPPLDVSTLQAALNSLRADIDTILEARVLKSEAPSVAAAEDTVLASLFATSEIPPPPSRECDKMHTGRAKEQARARKKESQEMEAARRAALTEGEVH